MPEGGYPSGFVKGLGSAYEGKDDVDAAGRWAADRILRYIRTQLEAVHIHYDEWFSQASIEESAAVEQTIDVLPMTRSKRFEHPTLSSVSASSALLRLRS